MKFSEETLRKVAEIARLRLSQAELASFRKELEEILAHFSKIRKMGEGEARYYGRELANALREDMAEECEEVEGILANFNRKEGRFLSAPKSLE
ncbi:MAG: Asp-tRNA(Asn)/Glu-tRNA(Gln) amidotransferase subunit GatC [Candidatus Micrarchaeia archaeon]